MDYGHYSIKLNTDISETLRDLAKQLNNLKSSTTYIRPITVQLEDTENIAKILSNQLNKLADISQIKRNISDSVLLSGSNIRQQTEELLSETVDSVPMDDESKSFLQDALTKIKTLTLEQILMIITTLFTVLMFIQGCEHNNQTQKSPVSTTQMQIREDQSDYIIDLQKRYIELLEGINNTLAEQVETSDEPV